VKLHELQEESYRRASPGILSSWPPEHALDAGELRSFLHERRYCVLATATGRGRPEARPVAFTVFGESFWFGSGASGRLRNVERSA
jgi:nitroimidazol reductase NimA-like FMN-containing flavoprotein (pyridoxamine 5'-phosphate oxidase superfamily)